MTNSRNNTNINTYNSNPIIPHQLQTIRTNSINNTNTNNNIPYMVNNNNRIGLQIK
jgi:hypothetical protein